MKELLEKLQVVFEVDSIDTSLKFEDYDEWDSLSSLSIIAFLDSDYGLNMTNKEITAFASIEDFCKYVLANGK